MIVLGLPAILRTACSHSIISNEHDGARVSRDARVIHTYPIHDSKGTMFACEIDNAYIGLEDLARLLANVADVHAVRARAPFSATNDTLVTFEYRGVPFIVLEPLGDSSRYWIGPDNPDAFEVDVSALEQILRNYRPRRWRRFVGDLVSLRFGSLWRR